MKSNFASESFVVFVSELKDHGMRSSLGDELSAHQIIHRKEGHGEVKRNVAKMITKKKKGIN